MNKIKILIPFLLIGYLVVFIGTAKAQFTDVINGQVVTVRHTGVVGGSHTFSVRNEQGESVNVSGTINENGRGVPNLSGITSGFFAGQTIQPPSVRHTTPLDSSPRHDEHFSNEVARGHNLVGFTDDPARNTLAPGAPVSVQEAVAIANRLAGNALTWGEVGERASRLMRELGITGDPATRNLSVGVINQILADAGSSVQVTGNTRGDFFRSVIPATGGGGGGRINGGNGGVRNGTVDDAPWFLDERHISPPPPPLPTCFSFTSDRSRIPVGQSTTLRWSCSNIDSCSISPDFLYNVGSFGNRKVSPQATTTYTLTCHGGNQSVSLTRTIRVFAIDDIREIPVFYDGFMRIAEIIGRVLR